MPKKKTVSTMDWFCKNCGGEGGIPEAAIEADKPAYVICSHCSHPDAYVWCEKCGMGGQFAKTDFKKKPSQWVCQECKTVYLLPVGFYDNPVVFTPQAFGEIGKINEYKIEEYMHVNPVWMRNVFLWLENKRLFNLIYIGLILFAIFMAAIISLPTVSKVWLMIFYYLSGLVILAGGTIVFVREIYLLIYLFARSRKNLDTSKLQHIPLFLRGAFHWWFKYYQFMNRLFGLAFLTVFVLQLLFLFFIPGWLKTRPSLALGLFLMFLIPVIAVYAILNFIIAMVEKSFFRFSKK